MERFNRERSSELHGFSHHAVHEVLSQVFAVLARLCKCRQERVLLREGLQVSLLRVLVHKHEDVLVQNVLLRLMEVLNHREQLLLRALELLELRAEETFRIKSWLKEVLLRLLVAVRILVQVS